MEAKDKKESQVAPMTNSCVNRLRSIIPDSRLDFNARQLGKFDWKMLVSSISIPNNEITQKIIDTYRYRSSKMNFQFSSDNDYTNKYYVCQQLREELLAIHPDPWFVCDVLVKHLFCKTKTRRKVVFWECFGREVVDNLKHNIDQNTTMCVHCGVRFYKDSPRQFMCADCAKKQHRIQKTRSDRARRAKTRTF